MIKDQHYRVVKTVAGEVRMVSLEAYDSLARALRTIYDDIPARPNMTEAGRVAMMAETARAALAVTEDEV